MTNVEPSDLNYHHYETERYDRDIKAVIPFHHEVHERIRQFLETLDRSVIRDVLELGCGTGLTTQLVRQTLPEARIDAVDFSQPMLEGAQRRLRNENIRYLLGDYTTMSFDKRYDLVVSVIGIHHQTQEGKQRLFKKIAELLNPGGTFVFADLVTYRDSAEATRNTQAHEQHMIEHAADEQTLKEWMHHHRELNLLDPIEDQEAWLRNSDFLVDRAFLKLNTALLTCQKKSGVEIGTTWQ